MPWQGTAPTAHQSGDSEFDSRTGHMSDDIDTNMSAYKKKHGREIDNLFRSNGMIQSQVAGTDSYRRGHIWNFEWCSEDLEKAKPILVACVKSLMENGRSFEDAFDHIKASYEDL